ncbi:MAG: pyridine nucleotide-disulfide oxidoreductase [Leptothrix sp. (in: Bacteria)]|nr:pyridine nucleotide-disulfide oxidoreductase [Leptothrix sp. (in: b-proteobacteria)]
MKRLLLLGGGHAHLHVLAALAQQRLAAAEVMLVTPHASLVYSGMVPGLVAGHYTAEQCRIDLAPLAAAAGVSLVSGAAVALDAAARRVHLADGRTAEYELLSLDTGSEQRRERLPGAAGQALFVRPIEAFVQGQQGLAALAAQRAIDVVVLGGGAAGFELALALQHRLHAAGAAAGAAAAGGGAAELARVALVTGGAEPLAGYPPAVLRAGARVLAAARITVFREAAAAIEPGIVRLASGARLACDAAVVATGAEAPSWLAGSGLALCERGFVLTGPTLQSRSHPEVFAAGDVATREDAPHPKSGVHAVRAGPPLAANLRRFVEGAPLQPYRPPARTLNLLSCGARSALTVRGGLALGERFFGAAAWWWKDRIDRGFIARFSAPPGAGGAVASGVGTKGDHQP